MEYQACDKCGIQSPTKGKLYIANKWITVRTEQTSTSGYVREKKYLFCEECWEEIFLGLFD